MFTGIENTGKIKLSKEEAAAAAAVSEEDRLVAPLSDNYISEWRSGKPFLAASERVRLIFTSAPADPFGHTLYFQGFDRTATPSGSRALNIMFRDSIGRNYIYQRELHGDSLIRTSDLPMLVDLDIVAKADSLLRGRTLWPRTRFWDDAVNHSNTTVGTQLMPVKVLEVVPSSADFPLRVIFADNSGKRGSLVFNPSPRSSRSFSSQFKVTDPRLDHKKITDEKWSDICNGRLSTGMTKQEAKLSYGAPDDVESDHDYSKLIEYWYYSNGAFLRFEDGLLVSFRK